MTVLEMRPISACGVSRWSSVCAGTMTPANAKPSVKLASIAVGTKVNAPNSSAPRPIPASPASTSVAFGTVPDSRRTTGIPAIMPMPTMALTMPKVPAFACSHSRT